MSMSERMRNETERTYTPWELANESWLVAQEQFEDSNEFWYCDGLLVNQDYQ